MKGKFTFFLVLLCTLIVLVPRSINAQGTPPRYVLHPIVAGGNLTKPTFLTSPPGDARLFILEQPGRIRIVQNGSLLAQPFLDITDLVRDDASERGLLGMAFHPSYASNGYFYVSYTAADAGTEIARFQVSAGNPNLANVNSRLPLLNVAQPYSNHNGGMLAFGADSYLYIGMGDGGSGGDPLGHGQNTFSMLGDLLRIDVNSGSPYAIPPTNPYANGVNGLPEIWSSGLRNPWRFSFDRATGDLYIADVGQNLYEEINFQPAGSGRGWNYGWNVYEASSSFNGGSLPGTIFPIIQYGRSEGCSVTGGYVYRGSAMPELQGRYFYGDFCQGTIWSAVREGNTWTPTVFLDTDLRISSFGEDASGELYVLDYRSGAVYRIDHALRLNAPTNTITLPYGNPAYEWEHVTGAETYEVAVFRADQFAPPYDNPLYYSGVLDADTVCEGNTCAIEPTTQPNANENARLYNGLHYVFLRANGSSWWDGAYSFTLNTPAPSAAQNVSISQTNTLRPRFTWTATTGVTRYRLYIAPAVSFPNNSIFDQWLTRAQVCGSLTGTSCAFDLPQDLTEDTDYYAFVQGLGPGGFSIGGEFNNGWSGGPFRINTLTDPAVPTNIQVSINQGRPTIRWNDDANAERFFVAIYNWTANAWAYGAYHTKGEPMLNCASGICALLTDAMIFANGSYSVFINAEGDGGVSRGGSFGNGYGGPTNPDATNEPGDFVLDFAPPALVDEMSASYSGGQVTVSWDGVPGATWYSVWIGSYNAVQTYSLQWVSSTALNCQNGAQCSITFALALPSGETYLAVQSAGPGGYSSGGLVGNGYQVLETPFVVP
ncbi:MAG: PQQ-dependent sugar dehydrogenase [bacterium]|nr:PQQ-dependent sugar dehydrogenase [bacterium]